MCIVARRMSGLSLPAIGGAGPAVGAGLRRGIEHAVAVGYGLTYDAIVSSFPPYRALLDEVAGYAKRSVGLRRDPRSVHVLDVASGIGTLAFRLAREGYTIVGLDGVEYLVEIAREKRRARNVANVAFHRIDIGGDEVPWREDFDFAVSLHTLYWHPRPAQVLAATRRALRPGGHALFLNYSRPARVLPTFKTRACGQRGPASRGRRPRRAPLARADRPLRGLPRFRASSHGGRGVSRRPDGGGLRNPGREADIPRRDQLPGLGASRGTRRGDRPVRVQ